MKRETTEHRQVVIAAMLAVAATLMIMMFTAQKAHAAVEVITLQGGSPIAHCGLLTPSAATQDYTKRERNTRIIQRKLTQLGYNVGRPGVDGKFGPLSRGAAQSFQGDYNIAKHAGMNQEAVKKLAYLTHPHANVRRCKHEFTALRH